MKVKVYKDWEKGQVSLHILPSLDFFKTVYICDIQFSWLLWTLEWTLWDENDSRR
jgi:hypothetical protein